MTELTPDLTAFANVSSFLPVRPKVPERTSLDERRRFRTIWISDIHLGTKGCNAELLIDFLDHTDSDTLYLGGDIIDEGFSCAHSDEGVMKCWGRNLDGQLGDGSTFDRIVAVDVLGMGDDVTSIATGSQHTCAVRNGGVHCWGDNLDSQLGQGDGDGVPVESRVPLAVPGLSSGVAQVSAGSIGTLSPPSAG